jgi:hypothetical protein
VVLGVSDCTRKAFEVRENVCRCRLRPFAQCGVVLTRVSLPCAGRATAQHVFMRLLTNICRQYRTAACMQRSENVAHAQSARTVAGEMLHRGYSNA